MKLRGKLLDTERPGQHPVIVQRRGNELQDAGNIDGKNRGENNLNV